MSNTLFDLTVPVHIRSLENLSNILKKAEKWADENNVPHERLLEARLIDDMRSLPFQVWCASNTSKALLTRLAGLENVPMEDNQNTFADLRDRIRRTIDALKTIKPEDLAGKETAEVRFSPAPGYDFTLTGISYLQRFGYPNFWFHVNAVYAILRSQGVPIGKLDYIGMLRPDEN